jgi:hypothetical protein
MKTIYKIHVIDRATSDIVRVGRRVYDDYDVASLAGGKLRVKKGEFTDVVDFDIRRDKIDTMSVVDNCSGNRASIIILPEDLRRSILARAAKVGAKKVSARGRFNGYGYNVSSELADTPEGRALYAEVVEGAAEKPKRPPKTEAEVIAAWAKRLDKLTGCGVDVATEIAAEKIEYKEDKIAEMQERDDERGPSRRRDVLIRQMKRANPLRRIVDSDHAAAILAASERHNNTDYDALLDEGRELAAIGEIDKSEIKEYARTRCA